MPAGHAAPRAPVADYRPGAAVRSALSRRASDSLAAPSLTAFPFRGPPGRPLQAVPVPSIGHRSPLLLLVSVFVYPQSNYLHVNL